MKANGSKSTAPRTRLPKRATGMKGRDGIPGRARVVLNTKEALRLANERFEMALRNASIVVFNQDLDLRYTWIYNPVPGFEPAAILGKRDLDLVERAADAARLEAIKRKVLRSGVGQRQEVLVHRMGVDHYYDLQVEPLREAGGRVVGVCGSAVDITERRQTVEALTAQQRLYKSVTDNTSVALFIMDEKQQCSYMNPAAEQLTGYTLKETRGRPLHDVVHHTHPDGSPYPQRECPIDQAFPKHNKIQGEEVFVHKDGHFYDVAFTASPLPDARGRTVGTIIEVQDITGRKRAEAALVERAELRAKTATLLAEVASRRQAEEQLRALSHRVVQNHETERGRVARELHDNITQLLCAILVRSQALADRLPVRYELPKREAIQLREMLGQTAEEVERISRHLRPSVLDQLGLVAVLRETSTEFTQRTGVAVKLSCVPLTARLPANTELTVYRILQEALNNVEQHAHARHVTVRLRRQRAFVRLTIADDGIGFAPERHSAQGKGGLGLLSMRERATYVGGTLDVKSTPRAGTTIEVNIPLSPGRLGGQPR